MREDGGKSVPQEAMKPHEEEPYDRSIPMNELVFEATRSGGPGGQGVNTTDSAVIVRWNVIESSAFSEEEKDLILRKLDNKINKLGELVMRASSERSQKQNKEDVIERLNKLVAQAIEVQAERTLGPTRAKQKQLKAMRKKSDFREKQRKVARSKWNE